MMHYFVLDNEKSRSYGLYLTGSGAFNAPERAVETLEVPGRNGNLIIDQGHFKNVIQSYKAFVPKDFPANAAAIRAWLLSKPGYRRLEDTYNPEYYRLARYAGSLNFDVRALCRGAETELLFDCKPQRFLKSGETAVSVSSGSSIYNPTRFDALPIITVKGSGYGTVSIGNTFVLISSIDTFVTIDCEMQDAYKNSENKNGTIHLSEFPKLSPGASAVSFSGGISEVLITPRWWTL